MAGAQVVRQFGLRGEGFLVEAGGGAVEAFEGTQPGQFDPLGGARRRGFAFEEAGQLAVQFDQAFALPHPLGRGVGPARVAGAEFVAAAQLLQGLAELALSLRAWPRLQWASA